MPRQSLNPRRASGPPTRRSRAPKRNADKTRERILLVAIDEFAAEGYSGARVETICRAAHANPRMLYHHFGDKDGLYLSVLEEVIGELRREELKIAANHQKLEPFEGIMQLFDFIDRHFGEHPEFIQLLSGENLLRARFLRRSDKAPIVTSPLVDLIDGLLRRGEHQGVIRPGIEPLHLYVMMVALCYFHRSNAYTLSAIFRTDVQTARWCADHREAGADMLRRYLRSE
jgi:AcrR family transcriptional regulator